MFKKIIPFVLIFVNFSIFAQVGIGTTAPNNNSILDLTSTSKGFLPPRLTTSEKTSLSIGIAEEGMLVFDTTETAFYYWDGTQWLLLRIDNVVTDFEASGNLYLTSEATTTISSANTPTKISGTTSGTNLIKFSTSGNNRLVYNGDVTRSFTVICSISFEGDNSNNTLFSFYIAKGSSLETTAEIESTKVFRYIAQQPDIGALSVSGSVSLSNGEWIEVWAEAESARDLIVKTFNLIID